MHGFDISIPKGTWVDTFEEAEYWKNKFLTTYKKNGGLGLDTETTGRDNNIKELVIVWSLSDGIDRICLPASLLEIFKEPILENPLINLDLSNACFDAHRLANTGVDISKAGEWRDTTVMSWLLNENNTGRHGLKECIEDHFGRKTPTFKDVFGMVPRKTKANPIPKTVGDLIRDAFLDPDKRINASDYASLDSYNSTVLRALFDEQLKKQGLYEHFYNIEVPFTKVLWNMERRGITVDYGHLLELETPMKEDMLRIEKDFAKEAGKLINLNSTAHVREFFIDHLKKDVVKMTKGGKTGVKKPSTDEEVLEEWAEDGDPWANKLLEHRSVAKIYGTYVMGLSSRLDRFYRLHTTFNQHGTVTGRLSSTNPNLQNIPRPAEDKFKIREAFIPSELMILIVADYAQLEMRLMAHFSGDVKMIKAIIDGIDLHCFTVAEMNGIPYDEVIAAVKAEKKHKKGELGRELTDRELDLLFKRQSAKAIGFGIIYGIGGRKLAADLTKAMAASNSKEKRIITTEEGDHLIAKWLGVFPGVKAYIDATHVFMTKNGYVQTALGRFRRFGDLKGMNFKDRSKSERQGVNSVIQGTASDIAKVAMITAESDPELSRLGARMLLQIHDEIVWECPKDPETVKQVKKRVQEIMEHPFSEEFSVPLPVEVGHGYSWASAK